MHRMIVVDTIGKLHAFGNQVFGHCRPCAALYRMDTRPEDIPPSSWEVDLPALIAERGADHPVVGMTPVSCPYCGSRQTETRILGGEPESPSAVSISRWNAC